MDPGAKASLVKLLARQAGFDRVGIAPAAAPLQAEHYRPWLAAGYAGTMHYLARWPELRENPGRLLPQARSVICVALSYHRPASQPADPPPQGLAQPDAHPAAGGMAAPDLRAPPCAPPGEPDGRPVRAASPRGPAGRVAMYARGVDYHVVMRQMLEGLVQTMRERLDEPFEARVFVDTGPLLERQLAQTAGLGWVGKNTLLLHERLGSYVFLGEVVTTLELEPDRPATDHCGTCRRCLDACPTQAFPQPYVMDASRCISYLTIEYRGEIPPELAARMGTWVYGCDACQEVCPFNRQAPPGRHPQIMADRIPGQLDLLELVRLRSGPYRRLTRGTAARRASRRMWQRNAQIAWRNARAARGAAESQMVDRPAAGC